MKLKKFHFFVITSMLVTLQLYPFFTDKRRTHFYRIFAFHFLFSSQFSQSCVNHQTQRGKRFGFVIAGFGRPYATL